MPALPWQSVRAPDPAREYLVLLSFLPLTRLAALPRFLLLARRVARQLDAAPGLVGYCFHARLLTLGFWTLSVWEDEAHLGAFVGAARTAPPWRPSSPRSARRASCAGASRGRRCRPGGPTRSTGRGRDPGPGRIGARFPGRSPWARIGDGRAPFTSSRRIRA